MEEVAEKKPIQMFNMLVFIIGVKVLITLSNSRMINKDIRTKNREDYKAIDSIKKVVF